MDREELEDKMKKCDDERIFVIAQWLRNGYGSETIQKITGMDPFFLYHIQKIIDLEKEMTDHPKDVQILRQLKKNGFSDSYIARNWQMSEYDLYQMRKENGIMPVYKMVDTCAGEFTSATPYLYSSYEQENESIVSDRQKIIVLGSGRSVSDRAWSSTMRRCTA